MKKITRRTEAVVRLDALAHNIRNIRSRLAEGVQIMAVLKGDGYGHGIPGIYPTLKACGVERINLVTVANAASDDPGSETH
jgi:alanine racemase